MLDFQLWYCDWDLPTYKEEPTFDQSLSRKSIKAVSVNEKVEKTMKSFARESETLPTLSECRRSLKESLKITTKQSNSRKEEKSMFYYDYKTIGEALEQEFRCRFMPYKGYGGSINWSNKDQDTKEGTDFFCEHIRFDLSVDFNISQEMFDPNHKDNMWYGKGNVAVKVVSTGSFDIYIGLRCGNKHSDFKEPVVVLGGWCDWAHVKAFAQAIVNHWKSIVDAAFDLWCAYDDANQ